MLGYAYRDKNTILLVTRDKKTAQQYAKEQIVALDCDYSGIGGKLFDYAGGKIYWGGNEKNGKALVECDPAIALEIKKSLEKIAI